jgi:hypothetical protein
MLLPAELAHQHRACRRQARVTLRRDWNLDRCFLAARSRRCADVDVGFVGELCGPLTGALGQRTL